MMETFVILFAILATFQARATSSQAPFQASIQWKDLYGAQTEPFQFHICSGIIIHEKYILTPASCLLLPTLINTNFSRLLLASELTVIAGFHNKTTFTERNVVSIIPHNKFNKTTFDNDIAVLKLDRILPFSPNNAEIQWLDITTGVSTNASCFSTIFNSSSQEFYSIAKSPTNLQHWLCEDDDDANEGEVNRKNDVCLEYFNAAKENCNASSSTLRHSRERGTAYICNNKLVAILADINRSKNVEKCFLTRRTTAFYVNVTMHLDWLLSESGLTNLGMKNRSDSQSIPSWSSTTERIETTTPKMKNSSEKIDESLLILIILAGVAFVCKV